jgi:hypothetical protein
MEPRAICLFPTLQHHEKRVLGICAAPHLAMLPSQLEHCRSHHQTKRKRSRLRHLIDFDSVDENAN